MNETNELWRGFRQMGKERRDRRECRLVKKLDVAVNEGKLEVIQHSRYHYTVWLPGERAIAAAGFWPRTSRIRLKQETYFGGIVRLTKLLELAVDRDPRTTHSV